MRSPGTWKPLCNRASAWLNRLHGGTECWEGSAARGHVDSLENEFALAAKCCPAESVLTV
jgi:hypothetical protein